MPRRCTSTNRERGDLSKPIASFRHQRCESLWLFAEPFGIAGGQACLALALVVVPTVVEKVDAGIERLPDNRDRGFLGDALQRQMPAADANCGNAFTGAAQLSIQDVAHDLSATVFATYNPKNGLAERPQHVAENPHGV